MSKKQIGGAAANKKITSKHTEKIVEMRNFLSGHKGQLFQCFLALLIFLCGTYRLKEVGQPILFNDEFGYWSASSFFLGIDWSSLTSHIAYYSYGYGILLALVRCVGHLFMLDWRLLYEAAVVLNALMLVGSFFLASKLSERYFDAFHPVIRGIVCFAAVIYPSNVIYAHITWTENTLTFLFWMFLYLLMRCIDKPSVKNHIGFAFTAFYIYTVHQRALSILMAGILIILFMRFLKVGAWKHTAAFFGTIYLWTLVHSMIKGKLQNDFYLGNEAADFRTTLGFALNRKSAVFLAAVVALLLCLYLIDKGRTRLALWFVGGVALIGVVFLIFGDIGGVMLGNGGEERLSTNDFSGQWYKIKGIFTVNGLLRLGISMVGKWFYLAAATGLIICFGMKDLIKHGFWMAVYSIQTLWRTIKTSQCVLAEETTQTQAAVEEHKPECPKDKKTDPENRKKKAAAYISAPENIWRLGVFFACAATFMVCAIYKEGFYKVDDLVNGRYNEYVIGILLVISLDSLLKDKKWLRTACICVVLYILSGILCQTAFDEIGRTDFELSHSVMFGRVFWNWEVPAGKVKEISGYVLPLGISFLLIVKAGSSKFPKAAAARFAVGLLIPIVAWTYLSSSIIHNYVVARNEKQAVTMPTISLWVSMLATTENVYYLADTYDYRWAEGIQFMMQDRKLTVTDTAHISFDEDAFFIMSAEYADSEAVLEKCSVIIKPGALVLAVNKEGKIMDRWRAYEPSRD